MYFIPIPLITLAKFISKTVIDGIWIPDSATIITDKCWPVGIEVTNRVPLLTIKSGYGKHSSV